MHVSRLLNRSRKAAVAAVTAIALGLSAPMALAVDPTSPPEQDSSVQDAAKSEASEEATADATDEPKAKTESKKPDPAPTESTEPAGEDTEASETTEPAVEESVPTEPSDGEATRESTPPELKDADGADSEEESESPGGVSVLSIPNAEPGEAVVNVKTGGVRDASSTVAPLAGVVLGLFQDENDATPEYQCTSDSDGDCSFVVDIGGNSDPSMWVKQISAPAGYFINEQLRTGGTGAGSTTDYVFETPTLFSGQSYYSTTDFMYATGNNNADASSGTWQQSVNNPPAEQQCGLDAALLLDVSGSVAPDLNDLKGAANSMVDALVGTPSQLALYTFNDESPSSAGGGVNQPLRNVSTAGDAENVKDDIDGLSANSGTNWDEGLWALSQIADTLDVVIVVTDGNPTFYGPSAEGPGNYTRFREMENAIFSANAIKAKDARIITLGVGDGLGTAAALNLRAVSGDGAYYQSESYDAAAEIVRGLALGACQNRLSVIKQTVDANGENAQVAGGWDITAGGSIVDGGTATKTTAPATGGVNFDLTIPGGGSGTVNVSEDLTSKPNFQFSDVECTDTTTGNPLTVSSIDAATGSFDVDIPSTQATASCTITNQAADPASVVFEKNWVIGGTTYTHGTRPSGYDAQGLLNDDAIGIGSERGGFEAGDSVTIGESTTTPTDQPLCEAVVEELVSVNGTPLETPVTLTDNVTYDLVLESGTNVVGLRNTQDCESRLTLEKTVQGGDASPDDWTLTAVTPDGAIEGPAGTTGVTGEVSTETRYVLTESGDSRYVQTVAPNAEPTPPATGSWQCTKLDGDGVEIPGSQYDGLNGGVTVPRGQWASCEAVNVTAELTLLKDVTNDAGGDAAESDFDLTATPTGTVPDGLEPETVTGATAESADNTFLVRPGTAYELTESDVAGYDLDDLVCLDGDDEPVDLGAGDAVTVPAGEHYTCTFRNGDVAPTLTLVKEIGGNGDQTLVDAWTLTASDAEGAALSGTNGVNGEVEAGVDYTLNEELIDADGAGRAYYQEGTWTCTNEDGTDGSVTLALGEDVTCTVTNVPVAPVTIVKEAGDVVQDGSDANLWSVEYTLTATNSNPVGVEYTITDSISVPTGAAVDSINVTDAPLGVDLNTGFDGEGDPTIAADVEIGAGDPDPVEHVYTVTVVYRTTGAATVPQDACDDGSGHIIANDATVTTYDLDPLSDDACVTIPEDAPVTVSKTETLTEQNDDGTWTITYDVVATNSSATLATSYDAVDVPTFGDGITINDAAWTGATSGTFSGDPLTGELATDRTLAAGASDTYTVTINASVAATSSGTDMDCEIAGEEDGTGFLNTATITVAGQEPVSGSDCSSPVVPEIEKTVATPAAPDTSVDPWSGEWTIAYQVTVSNPSSETGLVYSLTDVPAPSVGTITGADVTGAGTLSWVPADGDFVLVPAGTPKALAAGASDTYTITMAFTVPLETDLPVACGDDDSGLFNTATVVSGDFTDSADACGELPDLPSITLIKEVENGNATEGVADDQDWNLAANGDDDTPFDTSGLSEHTSTVLPGTYSLSETLLDDSFAGLYTASEWVCTVNNEPLSGFVSPELTVENGDDVVCTITNTLVDPVEIEKTSDGVETTGTAGEWTVDYTLTVTNPNLVPTVYDLTDVVTSSEYVTVTALEVTSTPDGVTADGSFDGTAANSLIASDVSIGVGDPEGIHVYTIRATLETYGATSVLDECEVGNLNNEGTVTTGPAGESSSDVCDRIPSLPSVGVDKTVASSMQNDDGTWTITYDVVATNSSDEYPSSYNASDDLQFGGGIEVVSAEWIGPDGGDVTAFDEDPWSADLASERDIVAGGSDTFTVMVVANVTTESTTETRDCELVEGEEGTGFLNSAQITVGGELSATDTACASPAVPTIEKSAQGPATPALEDGVWNGLWDVQYEITVMNDDASEQGVVYSLTDTFAPSLGEVVGGTASGGQLADDVAWDGVGDFVIIPADGVVSLAAGGEDVYTVDLQIRTATDIELPLECGDESGLRNTGTVTSGTWVASDDDCTGIPELPELTLVKVVDNGDVTEGVAGPEAFDLNAEGATSVSGAGEVTGRVIDGMVYDLDESLNDMSFDGLYYQDGDWSCESDQVVVPRLAMFAQMFPTAPGAVTINGDTTCTVINKLVDPVAIEKTSNEPVASTETPGEWTVEYTLTVTNPNSVATIYDIDDMVEPADGIDVTNVDVTASPEAATLNGDFNGTSDKRIASDVEIGVEGTHIYTVVATLNAPGVIGEDTCDGGNLANTGTATTGTLTPVDDSVCDEIPELPAVDIVKTVVQGEGEDVGTEPSADNDWTVEYTVEVTNSSEELPTIYSLTDTPMYGAGIDITSATWTGPGEESGEFTGEPLTADLATDRELAAGATETWTVTITSVVTTESTVESRDCELAEGEDGTGFLNSATATAASSTVTDTDCSTPKGVDLMIEKTVSDLPETGEPVDAGDEFNYTLSVSHGEKSLNDATAVTVKDTMPAGLTVVDADSEMDGVQVEGLPEGWTAEVAGDGSTVTFTYDGVFELGAEAILVLPVSVDEEPPGDFINNACVSSEETELDGSNNCDDVTTTVKRIVPNAGTTCLKDIPYVTYDIELFNVDNPDGPVTATWRDKNGAVARVDVIPLDELQGKLLWPGGVVDEDGVSIGWPGWREAREGETPIFENMVFDETLDNALYRETMTVEFAVNPSSTLTVEYPPAASDCAVERDPDLIIEKSASVTQVKAGDSFDYTLEVANQDLGAASDVVLTDEIPANLKVNGIDTSADEFPRWTDCEVTGKDSSGYGGTLECNLNGVLGRDKVAPPVVLDVSTSSTISNGEAIINTGEVCWDDADKPDEGTVCAEDAVVVVVSGMTVPAPPKAPLTPSLPTTGADTAGILGAMALLMLIGSAFIVGSRRRRRS